MVDRIANFMREVRDQADGLDEQIFVFILFLLFGSMCLVVVYGLLMSIYKIPKISIPIYLSIFILWKLYKRF